MSDANTVLQNERKQWALSLLGGQCARCGSTDSLEFDHVDPSQKEFAITTYLKGRLDNLIQELAKCQLLCKSCHIEKSKADNLRPVTHGKQYAAISLKCECKTCTVFRKSYNTQRRVARGGNPDGRSIPDHGTYARYKRGCKCEKCKSANTEYMKDYYKKKKQGSVV